jgi:hypothetical protein
MIERPAITLSKAAVVSKSERMPAERLCLDRSKNKILFNTALLHICPGTEYWALSIAEW